MNTSTRISGPVFTIGDARRILLVGSTGSGKTTLARLIGTRTGLPVVELDTLFWGPNWTRQEGFLEKAAARISDNAWIVEGGYSAVIAKAWPIW